LLHAHGQGSGLNVFQNTRDAVEYCEEVRESLIVVVVVVIVTVLPVVVVVRAHP